MWVVVYSFKVADYSFFDSQDGAQADATRQRDVAAQGVAPQPCLEGHGLREATRI